MTPQEQKELAEFGAEFLNARENDNEFYLWIHKDKPWDDSIIAINPKNLFDDLATAPHLAHLAKREMEKRGFESFQHYRLNSSQYVYYIQNANYQCFKGEGENEYQALWLAIRENQE